MDWYFFVHYFLHLIFPGVAAYAVAPRFGLVWWKVYGILLATMLVDLDHLLADPMYDAARCGIGFHPMHSWMAWILYVGMLLFPNVWVRLFGAGCLFHMLVDWGDCVF